MKKITITSLFALLLVAFMPLAMDAQTLNEVKEITTDSNVNYTEVVSSYVEQAENTIEERAKAQTQVSMPDSDYLVVSLDAMNQTLTPSTPVVVSGTITNNGAMDVENLKLANYNSYNIAKNSAFYNFNVKDGLESTLAVGAEDTFSVEVSLTENSLFTINKTALEAIEAGTATPDDVMSLISSLVNDIFTVNLTYDKVGGVTGMTAGYLSTDLFTIDASENMSVSRTGALEVPYTTEGTVEVTYTNDGLNVIGLNMLKSYDIYGTIGATFTVYIDGKEMNDTTIFTNSELILNPGDKMVIKAVNKGESLDGYEDDKLTAKMDVEFLDIFFGGTYKETLDLVYDSNLEEETTDNTTDTTDNTTDTTDNTSSTNEEETLTSTGSTVLLTATASGSTIAGAFVLLRRKF